MPITAEAHPHLPSQCMTCAWFNVCRRPKEPCFWRIGTRLNLAPVVVTLFSFLIGTIAAMVVEALK